MINYLENNELPDTGPEIARVLEMSKQYMMYNGVLYYDRSEDSEFCKKDYELQPMRIAVPVHLRKQIMHEAHGSELSGHFGLSKVYRKLKRRYWWRDMRGQIKSHIHGCLICAALKETIPDNYPRCKTSLYQNDHGPLFQWI